MTDSTSTSFGDPTPALSDGLASLGILSALAPQTVAGVGRIARVLELAAGAPILTEGECSKSLYLVEQGRVVVYRTGYDGEHRLNELGPGDSLGEMGLLDGDPRSASARAETDCRLFEIPAEDLLSLPNGGHLLADLRASLAVAVVQRMRNQTDEHVAALEREVRAIQERQQFGKFFIYTLTVMAIGTLVNGVISQRLLQVDIYTQQFAWQYLVVLLIPSIAVIWRMGIPLRDLGITTVGLRQSLIEGAILSAIAVGLAIALAQVLKAVDALPGKPLPLGLGSTVSYFLHSIFQELVARGFLQSSFQRFLGDEGGARSVVLAAVLFGMFHLHFGFTAVALTILSGCVFGAVYLRHRNLAGVSLLHFVLGHSAFTVGLI